MGWRDFSISLPGEYGEKGENVTDASSHIHLIHLIHPEKDLKNDVEKITPGIAKGSSSQDVLVSQTVKSEGLDAWIERIKQCQSIENVFVLMDQFRPLPWTDQQRAQVCKVYINRLDLLRQAE